MALRLVVHTPGAAEVSQRLNARFDQIQRALAAAAKDSARDFLEEVAANLRRPPPHGTPVRTGRLKRSLRLSVAEGPNGFGLRIEAVWYGFLVDQRTGFATRAVELARQRIPAIVRRNVARRFASIR